MKKDLTLFMVILYVLVIMNLSMCAAVAAETMERPTSKLSYADRAQALFDARKKLKAARQMANRLACRRDYHKRKLVSV